MGLAALVACGMSAAVAASPADAAARKPATLTVLVTNDDGVAAPGIDALVEALRTVKNTKVVVVAPATNQSGSSEKTTPGTLPTAPATTASGYTATAVTGYPADSVTAALDQLGVKPNVVFSGSNLGENLGTFTEASGTVGAAKMAVQRGIPALAVSQGMAAAGSEPQFASSAKLAVAWLKSHRAALLKKLKVAPTSVEVLNVPNCPAGQPRGLATVATATTGSYGAPVDCTSTMTKPTTDIEAFSNGYAALATVPAGTQPAT
jgi:5'-nucleotidase